MAEQPPSDRSPNALKELPNLVESSKLTRWQKTQNFVGFGWGLNTALSVGAVTIIRKIFAPALDKWEGHIARKFATKAIKKELGETYSQLPAEEKATIDEHYLKRGHSYAKKKIEGYLLSIGGFLVLPGQSALENYHYGQNVLKPVNNFRKDALAHIDSVAKGGKTIGDMAEEMLKNGAKNITTKEQLTEALLDQQIAQQKAKLDPLKDKKEIELLNNAKKKPEYSLLGDATKKGLPRWLFGRVTALAAAYTTQSVVETIAGDKKEKVDMILAKIFTKIFHPKGFTPSPDMKETFKAMGVEGIAPEGVDPTVLKNVRMFTTDAYMTTAALVTHNVVNEALKPLEKRWEGRQAAREANKAVSSPSP